MGLQDEGYFDALIRMFAQARKILARLPKAQRLELESRLNAVRDSSEHVGYGVSAALDDVLAEYDADD